MSQADGFQKHPENINRKGPPKKDNSWRAIYEQAFDEIVGTTGNKRLDELVQSLKIDKKTWKEAVAKIVRIKALSGDINFVNNAQNRMDGPPKQDISIEHNIDENLLEILKNAE